MVLLEVFLCRDQLIQVILLPILQFLLPVMMATAAADHGMLLLLILEMPLNGKAPAAQFVLLVNGPVSIQ